MKEISKVSAPEKFSPYFVAVLSVLVATIISLLLAKWLQQTPTPFFTAAVVFTAWYCGMKPALFSAVLSAFARHFIFFRQGAFDAEDAFQIITFLLVAFLIGTLFDQRRRAQRDLETA